jgi:hypothetical protein
MSRTRDPNSYRGQLREELRRRCLAHYEAGEIPTSNRFLYYELKQGNPELIRGGVRPDGPVIVALTELRQDGTIPWDWIVDETRDVDDHSGFPTVEEGVLLYLDGIHLCPWDGQPPIVICESRSLAGVLRIHVSEYRALITSTNGQNNGFARTKLKDRMQRGHRVLYFGDYNRAGSQIEGNTHRILDEEVGDLDWERLALTKEQVERYHLPIKDVIDKRNGSSGESVECEAMSQARIVQILRRKLDSLLPAPLKKLRERETQQRERIRKHLAAL